MYHVCHFLLLVLFMSVVVISITELSPKWLLYAPKPISETNSSSILYGGFLMDHIAAPTPKLQLFSVCCLCAFSLSVFILRLLTWNALLDISKRREADKKFCSAMCVISSLDENFVNHSFFFVSLNHLLLPFLCAHWLSELVMCWTCFHMNANWSFSPVIFSNQHFRFIIRCVIIIIVVIRWFARCTNTHKQFLMISLCFVSE